MQPFDRLEECDEVGPLELVEAVDVGPFGVEPEPEAAQAATLAAHALGPQGQCSFGHVAARDGVDAGLAAQCRGRFGFHSGWRAVGDADVEQRRAHPERGGSPVGLDGPDAAGVDHLVDGGDPVQRADGVAELVDVVGRDGVQVGITAVQHEADQTPGQVEVLVETGRAQGGQLVLERLGLSPERQAELIGDEEGLEHPDAQQPAPVRHPRTSYQQRQSRTGPSSVVRRPSTQEQSGSTGRSWP